MNSAILAAVVVQFDVEAGLRARHGAMATYARRRDTELRPYPRSAATCCNLTTCYDESCGVGRKYRCLAIPDSISWPVYPH